MKKKLRNMIITIIFLGIILILPNKVRANTLSISASKTTLEPGQTTTITVTSDSIGRVNLSVTGNATITGDRVWLEGNSQSFTLTAKGTGTVKVIANPDNPMSLNGNKVELSATSCTINVKEKTAEVKTTQTQTQTTKSNTATLANLGIKPNDFSGFTPSKTNYSVTVPNTVSSVEVYANKGQSGQTISGTGKKNLQEGANTFNVNVTAEDGKTKKTYTITVNREKAEETTNNAADDNTVLEETSENEEDKEKAKGLASLKIAGITLSPGFKEDVYEYTAKLIGDKTTLEINAQPKEETEKIEIVGNENLKEGENVITILVSNQAGENTATYQITVNKSLVDEEAVAKEKQAQEKEKKKRYMIIGITSIAIAIIIIILIIRHRKNKEYEREYTNPYIENNWDNQEQDYTNKDTQEDNVQPYKNNFEEQKLEENTERQNIENSPDEIYEKPKRKKHAKGKRFK